MDLVRIKKVKIIVMITSIQNRSYYINNEKKHEKE